MCYQRLLHMSLGSPRIKGTYTKICYMLSFPVRHYSSKFFLLNQEIYLILEWCVHVSVCVDVCVCK